MNKKKKWASILTIATSLVLCIISTFGITLAFFGGNASANLSTITLKTGIEIGAAIESSVGSAKVVPGQPVKITATGTVSATTQGTNPDANNAVDGVVRAKFNVGNELGEVTIAGNTTDYWTAGGDGYYYLVTTDGGTTLRTVSKGTSVQIFGDLIVSKNFTNTDSGKSVEASVIFEVIQADIYKTDGTKETLTVTNATTSTSPLYSAFGAVEYGKAYNVTLHVSFYNSDHHGHELVTAATEMASLKIDEREELILDGSEGTLTFAANTLIFGPGGYNEELADSFPSSWNDMGSHTISVGYGPEIDTNMIWQIFSYHGEYYEDFSEYPEQLILELTEDVEMWLQIWNVWD